MGKFYVGTNVYFMQSGVPVPDRESQLYAHVRIARLCRKLGYERTDEETEELGRWEKMIRVNFSFNHSPYLQAMRGKITSLTPEFARVRWEDGPLNKVRFDQAEQAFAGLDVGERFDAEVLWSGMDSGKLLSVFKVRGVPEESKKTWVLSGSYQVAPLRRW